MGQIPQSKDMSAYKVPGGWPNPPPCRAIKEDIDFSFLPRLLKAIFNVLFKSEKRIKDYPKFGSDL